MKNHKQKPAEWKSSVVSIMFFMFFMFLYSVDMPPSLTRKERYHLHTCPSFIQEQNWRSTSISPRNTVMWTLSSSLSKSQGQHHVGSGIKFNLDSSRGSPGHWTWDWNDVNEDKVHHTQTHSGPVEGNLLSWTSICPRHPSSAPPCRSEPAGPPRSGTWGQMRCSVKNLRTQRTLTWAQCSPTATVFSADWSERHQWHHSEGPPPDPAKPDQDPSQPDQMEMLGRVKSRKQTDVNLTVFYCSNSHCHQTCDSRSQSAASDSLGKLKPEEIQFPPGPSWDTGLDTDFLFTQWLVVLYVNNWPITAEYVN